MSADAGSAVEDEETGTERLARREAGMGGSVGFGPTEGGTGS